MADGFTIRIFVPDGDADGVRIIDRLTSTGVAIVFPREVWSRVRNRAEFGKAGVYILTGYAGNDDLPTLYIGQSDDMRTRIDSHAEKKDFWDWGLIFCSKAADAGLNRAHTTWLEHALIKRALTANRSHLDNDATPKEPSLYEGDKADVQAFLKEILQILPLVGLRALEVPKPVAKPMTDTRVGNGNATRRKDDPDTIIVPAQKDGFDEVFLGQNSWWAIRISRTMLPKIKYIAAYQTRPVQAITHVAPVAEIVPYGEEGKFKLIFSEPATAITPIPFGNAPSGSMQGPRYTTYGKLLKAKTLSDLIA